MRVATRHPDNGKHSFLPQRVCGYVRSVRAVQNPLVFLTETRVIADATPNNGHQQSINRAFMIFGNISQVIEKGYGCCYA
jgi:hypothetical protein